eukprot:PhF_6_TR29090/c0_g1_i1/m.42421/K10436/MAPRE; microtubule-associated protein, RP/EB family
MQRIRKTHELIAWFNTLLDTQGSIQCLEDLRGGAYIAQTFHSIFPFDLTKIDFLSKNEYHYERNYKTLQQVFLQYGVEKEFSIPNLLAGEKRRDLYYFLIWIKLHYDVYAGQTNFCNTSYNAAEERAKAIDARKKKVSQGMYAGSGRGFGGQEWDESSREGCSTPRSNSTRTSSIFSQISRYTSYSSRYNAKARRGSNGSTTGNIKPSNRTGRGGGVASGGGSGGINARALAAMTAESSNGITNLDSIQSPLASEAPPPESDSRLDNNTPLPPATSFHEGMGCIPDMAGPYDVNNDVTQSQEDVWSNLIVALEEPEAVVVLPTKAIGTDWWALGALPGTDRMSRSLSGEM